MELARVAVAASVLVMAFPASGQAAGRAYEAPPTPAAVKQVLYAQPFTADRPFLNTWSAERAKASAGVLVVLEVDPAYLDPRDAVVNPVLYAGDAAVIRLNRGNESGRVIGIVPGIVDLAAAPIWFGAPELPERLTPAVVREERERAERAGIRPFAAEQLARIRRAPQRTPDVATLLRDVAAQLVVEFSPQEKDLADAWRLPTASATPQPRK